MACGLFSTKQLTEPVMINIVWHITGNTLKRNFKNVLENFVCKISVKAIESNHSVIDNMTHKQDWMADTQFIYPLLDFIK